MKKLITITIILSVTNLILSATNYQSKNNGNWNDNSKWDITPYPQTTADNADISNNITVPLGVSIAINNLTVGNNNTLTIIGNLSVYDLIINNNFDLVVTGILTVRHNIVLNNNSILQVNGGGTVAVANDFTFTGNSDAVINGVLSVGGTLSGGSPNIITGGGTVTATTYNVAGTIFGTASPFIAGATYPTPLPIELTYFKAYQNENIITIKWQTATELNNDYFTLERSADGVNYETIGTVLGTGTSMTALDYRYTDNNPLNGVSYYRLKQTDYDGAFEVFSPVSVSYLNKGELKVGPNPSSSEFKISMDGEIGKGAVKLYSMTGAVVKIMEINSNNTVIDVRDLPSGNYMMVISAGSKNITKKVVVQ